MTDNVKLIPVGVPKGILGEVNPDFKAQGLQDHYQPEPEKLPVYVIGPPGVKHRPRPLPKGTTIPPGGFDAVPWSFAGTKPYKWGIVRTVNLVAGAASLRLDTGRGNRVDIVLQNIGDFATWFNFTRDVAATNGIFVPGSPVAGAHLGGVWSASLDQSIQVWGIADAAGNTDVVVTELGY